MLSCRPENGIEILQSVVQQCCQWHWKYSVAYTVSDFLLQLQDKLAIEHRVTKLMTDGVSPTVKEKLAFYP